MPDGAPVGSKQLADAIAAFGWPPLLPLPVAIKYASRSRWTIGRAVAAGELAIAGRQGRTPVFRREDLDRWLLGQTGQSTPEAVKAPRRAASSTTNADAIAKLRAIAKTGSVNGNG